MVASRSPPTGEPAHNPGMCPDWEWKQHPFCWQAGTQSTEPHQLGLFFFPHFLLNLLGDIGSQNHTSFKCTTQQNIICTVYHAPLTQSKVSFYPHLSSPLFAFFHLPLSSFPSGYYCTIICVCFIYVCLCMFHICDMCMCAHIYVYVCIHISQTCIYLYFFLPNPVPSDSFQAVLCFCFYFVF